MDVPLEAFVKFIVIPKPPLLAVVIVPRGFCPKMRPC
ncbi:rfbP protein [Vibrio cholerae]|nr:rfbP protein [Vibrio cholerae]